MPTVRQAQANVGDANDLTLLMGRPSLVQTWSMTLEKSPQCSVSRADRNAKPIAVAQPLGGGLRERPLKPRNLLLGDFSETPGETGAPVLRALLDSYCPGQMAEVGFRHPGRDRLQQAVGAPDDALRDQNRRLDVLCPLDHRRGHYGEGRFPCRRRLEVHRPRSLALVCARWNRLGARCRRLKVPSDAPVAGTKP